MGATGRNIIKLIGGSAIGAGVGALLARRTESTAQQGPMDMTDKARDESAGEKAESLKDQGTAKVTDIRDSLRDRWQRAQSAGESAKETREAELRAYFREKVDDPTAFPPGAPTRQDR